MNCTVYIFGNLGQGYIQYPSSEKVFVESDELIDRPTQMIIRRENNLVSYKYIFRGTSFHIGLCFIANEVVALDVDNLYSTIALSFSALFDNNIPKAEDFQESSEALKEAIVYFERMLANSDFGYTPLEPLGSSTILQDTITLPLGAVNNDEIIDALSKYERVVVYKDEHAEVAKTKTPPALTRIKKETEEWKEKAKNYESSLLVKILIVVISFCIPYFMLLSPKSRTLEVIDWTRQQIYNINQEREKLSRELSVMVDSCNTKEKEISAIKKQLRLIETSQERTKSRRTISVGDVEFTMIKVNGGRFLMGSNSGEDDESPTHYVTLRGYYIGETEVTQELWRAVMYSNPSSSTGNERPVTNVSWNDCMKFVRNLNEMTGLSFALPTEAQWEFAARGGNKSRGYKYSGSDSYSAVANCVEYSFWGELLGYSNTVDYVASHSSNELGIYDMSGNVWEWCLDTYLDYPYFELKNPSARGGGDQMVIRGGGYKNTPSYCRSTYRGSKNYGESAENIGFRLVLNE